jgi:hypothetical protein
MMDTEVVPERVVCFEPTRASNIRLQKYVRAAVFSVVLYGWNLKSSFKFLKILYVCHPEIICFLQMKRFVFQLRHFLYVV